MLNRIHVIGSGRVGSAVSARLTERGVAVGSHDPELIVLCVPDRAIAEVAAAIEPGPWVAHVSGATPLAALDPHTRRFSACTRCRPSCAPVGPNSSTVPGCAVTARDRGARRHGAVARGETRVAAVRPRRRGRTLYHAGAVDRLELSSSRSTAPPPRLFAEAGAPPEALVPLMRRTIENDFELTGPITRGDWETIEAHGAAIREHRAGSSSSMATLAGATLATPMKVVRTIAELELPRHGRSGSCRRWARSTTGHLSLFAGAAPSATSSLLACSSTPPSSIKARIGALPARRGARRCEIAEERRRRALRPGRGRDVPAGFATWVEVGRARARLEGTVPSRPLPRGRNRLPEALQHRPPAPRVLRPEGCAAGRRAASSSCATWSCDVEIRVFPTVRDADGLALSSRNAQLSPDERARALVIPRALASARRVRAGEDASSPPQSCNGVDPDYVERRRHRRPDVLAVAAPRRRHPADRQRRS